MSSAQSHSRRSSTCATSTGAEGNTPPGQPRWRRAHRRSSDGASTVCVCVCVCVCVLGVFLSSGFHHPELLGPYRYYAPLCCRYFPLSSVIVRYDRYGCRSHQPVGYKAPRSSRRPRAIPRDPEPSRAIPSHPEPSRAIPSHADGSSAFSLGS